MAEVIRFNGITRHDLDPKVILEEAIPLIGDAVVIIGYDASGELYFASSKADGGEVLWLMELAKKALLEVEL